ncbi:hypothetical protein HS053_19915 [Tabrizicola sp. SY72]|nr:hypothetical protein [Tabrizicola sp. SY72]
MIEIALSRVGGANFENFAQGFFAATLGADYVPLGGTHDGGADGALAGTIFEVATTDRFMQASVTGDPKTKIRGTIRRLREFGRTPRSLIYATSQRLTLIDQIEQVLSEELDCRIVVRDGHYFQNHINNSPGALQSYRAYVAEAASFLDHIGSANTVLPGHGLPAKTLCVFIGQELERRRGKQELLEAVTDSLIMWSLEDTDPDQGKFLSADGIEQRVIETLPAAKTFFRGVMAHRLSELTTKGEAGVRKINYHKKENGYCLPFATRKLIREENVDDENRLCCTNRLIVGPPLSVDRPTPRPL